MRDHIGAAAGYSHAYHRHRHPLGVVPGHGGPRVLTTILFHHAAITEAARQTPSGSYSGFTRLGCQPC